MTSNLDSLTDERLEHERKVLLDRISDIDRIIERRKKISLEDITSNGVTYDILTSPEVSKDSKKKKEKKSVEKEKSLNSKKDTDKKKKTIKLKKKTKETTPIKATIDDMKEALKTKNIEVKSNIKRDELEEIIRANNLVRVSVKINKTRLEDK